MRVGEPPERTVDREQLDPGPLLDDVAPVDHNDPVGPASRRQAVGDDDRGPPVQEPVERALDQQLGRAVDVRGRLVEDEDPWVGQQRPSDRDQLPLSRRKAAATLSDRMLEAGWEAARDRVQSDHLGDPGHLLVTCLRLGEAQVFGDRAREQERVLEHNSELLSIPEQIELPEVNPVDEHGTAGRVVEPSGELGKRRLAATGLADNCVAGPRRDGQLDSVEDLAVAVGEVHSLERQLTLEAADRPRTVGAADVGLLVEHERDLGHRGLGGLQLGVDVGQRLQRLERERQQEVGRRQRADLT